MNCPEVRAALPEFVYGSLSPETRLQMEGHLGGCPDCRREAAALGTVRRLLNAAPAPAARVDTAALYRAAAERQARRTRAWRRLALAACAAGVALAAFTALARLEVRLDANQMVVRWGSPPAPPAPVLSPVAPPAPSAAPAPAADPRDVVALQERVRTLSELVQALADDGRESDERRGQEIARLRQQVRQWQGTSDQRWGDMQKDFAALYTAQFSNRKGVQP